MKNTFNLFIVVLSLCSPSVIAGQWERLVDKDLTHWDIFMGVPHKSSNIPGYENSTDVRFGKPIGLNKDPKNVFSVIKEDGDWVIRITGEVFAGLVTKDIFDNYHLKAKFKWGDKKWPPRLNKKRNSGILYHSRGNYDDFWNVWMTSLEFEVQQSDTGDFITISDDKVKAKSPCVKKSDGKYYYDKNAPLHDFSWIGSFDTGRCWKNGDEEKPHGKWNTVELITHGDSSIHVVNGKVVMRVEKPEYLDEKGWVPMRKGKIQLQSEAAEIYYKDIKIKQINKIPKKYAKY